MAYKALYRTYRPTTFEEVAGQQHIVKTIKNALATGKLAHAYLFTGPRGTGKTTMAKLLAKALNCEEGIGHQCNMCKNCRAIMEGTHPDVLELDAASNNSVDDVRELIDKVKYGTILGRYKVYIIDEVHMLSTGAFNALLKTLEEPPEHVIFILATTEPHKILPTILSRCQRYDFTKVSDKDIKERLRVVLEEEGIPFDDKAVDLIISLCDGGMRDALSILDQVLRYSGDKLNEQDIMDVFAIESTAEKLALLHSIIDNNVQDVLERLNKYILKGTDIKRLTDDLLGILKDALIYETSANTQYLSYIDESQAIEITSKCNEDEIMKMIQALLDAQKDFKVVPSIASLFQVTVLKMAMVKKDSQPVRNNFEMPTIKKEIKPNLETLAEVKPSIIEQKPVVEPVKQEVVEPVKAEPIVEEKPQEPVKVEEPVKEVLKPQPEPVKEEVSLFDFNLNEVEVPDSTLYIRGTISEDRFLINDELMIDIMVSAKKDIKNELSGLWGELKKMSAHPKLGKFAAMLMDCHILVASKEILILEYPSKKTAEKINLIANQLDLQTVIKTVFNKEMFIYAVDRGDSVRLQQIYVNKLQVGKLPKASEVTIHIERKN